MTVQWYRPLVIWQFLAYVYRRFMANEGLENAKSLTYTSLFAVVPLLTLILTILAAFPQFQQFNTQVQNMIFTRLLPSSSLELQSYLQAFSEQARNLTWAGAIMLVATAYLMLVNIERNFNGIWGVSQHRRGLSSFLLYWSVLSLSPLLLGVGLALSSYISSLSLFEAFAEVSTYVGVNQLFISLFSLLLTALGFTLLYVAVPNCGVHLLHGFVGGLVVAFFFMIVRALFTWAMSLASYAIVYGTFAALPIFLIWLYICWVVILFGANLVRCIPLFRESQHDVHVHRTILMLALLHDLWEKHQHGKTLMVDELVRERWPFVDVDIEECLDLLTTRGIVRAIEDDEYTLVQDLHVLSVWEFIRGMPWSMPEPEELEKPLPAILLDHLPAWPAVIAQMRQLEEAGQQGFQYSVDHFFRHHEVGVADLVAVDTGQ